MHITGTLHAEASRCVADGRLHGLRRAKEGFKCQVLGAVMVSCLLMNWGFLVSVLHGEGVLVSQRCHGFMFVRQRPHGWGQHCALNVMHN
jgi:hypothetical protein